MELFSKRKRSNLELRENEHGSLKVDLLKVDELLNQGL